VAIHGESRHTISGVRQNAEGQIPNRQNVDSQIVTIKNVDIMNVS
jgi:hypothetical protein